MTIKSTNISIEKQERPIAVVGIVFNKEGRVLLGLSTLPDELRKGKFCFPGGGHEKGETIYQTGVREIFEETGIKAKPLNLSPIIDTDMKGIYFIILTKVSGTIRMNEEFGDMDWFSPKLLPKEMLGHNKRMLTFATNQIKNSSKETEPFSEIKKSTQLGMFSAFGMEKARSGIYTNNEENRRLGRVGQKYGESQVIDAEEYMAERIEGDGASFDFEDQGFVDSMEDAEIFHAIAGKYNMSNLESASIVDYAASGYMELNEFLRGDPVEFDRTYMKNKSELLKKALNKLPRHTGKVERFGHVREANIKKFLIDYTNNDTVTMDSFTSTTSQSDMYVEGGGDSGSNIHYRIKSEAGRDISMFSMYESENEILFKAGAKFRVKNIEVDKSGFKDRKIFVRIDLEEVI